MQDSSEDSATCLISHKKLFAELESTLADGGALDITGDRDSDLFCSERELKARSCQSVDSTIADVSKRRSLKFHIIPADLRNFLGVECFGPDAKVQNLEDKRMMLKNKYKTPSKEVKPIVFCSNRSKSRPKTPKKEEKKTPSKPPKTPRILTRRAKRLIQTEKINRLKCLERENKSIINLSDTKDSQYFVEKEKKNWQKSREKAETKVQKKQNKKPSESCDKKGKNKNYDDSAKKKKAVKNIENSKNQKPLFLSVRRLLPKKSKLISLNDLKDPSKSIEEKTSSLKSKIGSEKSEKHRKLSKNFNNGAKLEKQVEESAIDAFLKTPERFKRVFLTQKKVLSLESSKRTGRPEAKIDSSLAKILRDIDEKATFDAHEDKENCWSNKIRGNNAHAQTLVKTRVENKSKKIFDEKKKEETKYPFFRKKRNLKIPALIKAQKLREKEQKLNEIKRKEKAVKLQYLKNKKLDISKIKHAKRNGTVGNREFSRIRFEQKKIPDNRSAYPSNSCKDEKDKDTVKTFSKTKNKRKPCVKKKSGEKRKCGSSGMTEVSEKKGAKSPRRFSSPGLNEISMFRISDDENYSQGGLKIIPSWAKSRALKDVLCKQSKDNFGVFPPLKFPVVNLNDVFRSLDSENEKEK